MDVNLIGLREVRVKDSDNSVMLMYKDGINVETQFETKYHRDKFLESIRDYSIDLINTFENIN